MIEVLKQALVDAKRNERHNNVAETRYWLNQYKLIAEQAIKELESQEPVLYWSFEKEYALRPSKYDEEDHPTHVPLYRKPPQRKPLTDDQIYEMYNEPRSDAEMVAFARAIEAAHGIKEQS